MQAAAEWQAGSATHPESPGFRRGLLFNWDTIRRGGIARFARPDKRWDRARFAQPNTVASPTTKSPGRKSWDTGYEHQPGCRPFPAIRTETDSTHSLERSISAMRQSFRSRFGET